MWGNLESLLESFQSSGWVCGPRRSTEFTVVAQGVWSGVRAKPHSSVMAPVPRYEATMETSSAR